LEIADGERIEEIARLMSGEVITESARLTAKALIND
jgi:DNA repair ATPase RecN